MHRETNVPHLTKSSQPNRDESSLAFDHVLASEWSSKPACLPQFDIKRAAGTWLAWVSLDAWSGGFASPFRAMQSEGDFAVKISTLVISAMPIGIVALVDLPQTAAADEVAPRHYVVKDESTTTGPNRALLTSGVWTLGLSYVPAVIVATESNRDADKRLYIPVAGPWLDLGSRGRCPRNEMCNHETADKVLIVVDGVFQGIGALNIVGAFLFPETRTVTVSSTKDAKPPVLSEAFRLVPAQVGARGYGLAAIGTF